MADKPIEQWTRQECEEYLKQYPKSLNSDAVRRRLDFFKPEIEKEKRDKSEKEEIAFWNTQRHSTGGIMAYMKKFPEGRFINECDNAYWNAIVSENQVDSYKKNFPNGKHIHECDYKKEVVRAAKKKEEELKKKEEEMKNKEREERIKKDNRKKEYKEIAKDLYYGARGFVDLFLR